MADLPDFLRTATDAILVLDREGRCVWTNDRARELLESLDLPAGGVPLDPTAEVWYDGRIIPHEDGLIVYFREALTPLDAPKTTPHDGGAETSLDQLPSLAGEAPQIVWTLDPSGTVVYLNQTGLDYFGLDGEAMPFGWDPVLHKDDIPALHRQWSRALENDEIFESELRMRRNDGAYRWHLARAAPVHDESGQISHWCGTSTDVHELKRSQEQLRFLAEAGPLFSASLDYEHTLDTVANLMVPTLADWCAVDILDEEGRIRLVTAAHIDPEKLRLGHELRTAYPPDAGAEQGIAHVMRTGRTQLYPDVSDEMLRASAKDEQHYELLAEIGFRSALIVPLTAREQTLGTMTLVWSESDRRYAPHDVEFAEEVARRAAAEIDNARLYREARDARSAVEAINETLEARVRERTAQLTAANEKLLREVEQRRRAQQELARVNSVLERRNRELQDFAHVASHDLQEPLRKIMAFATVLEADHAGRLEGAAPYIDRIVRSADRMTGLIRDLLAFSRVAAHEPDLNVVDLNDVLRDALSDLDMAIAEADATIEAQPLCSVIADPVQIRQLLQNLIDNAVKFRRSGVAPVVRIRSRTTDGACVVEVEDNGVGFDEKYTDRIFAPFQRLHSTAEFPGTGMGLAICRRIVERLEGSISVRSREGVGTTFSVRLPRQPASDPKRDGAS